MEASDPTGGVPPAADAARIGTVARKLGVGEDQVRAIVTETAVAGWDSVAAAAELRRRFGLDDLQPLGAALRERGLLTADEALWLGDHVH